jgi:hypothetical protein
VQVAPAVQTMIDAYSDEGYVVVPSPSIYGGLCMRLRERTPGKPLHIYLKTEKPFIGVSFLAKGDG